MKQLFLTLTAILLMTNKNKAQVANNMFKSERISKTATIHLNGSIEKVFPLFGAFEERKWADKWDPQLIYPATEAMEEGTAFKVTGHGHNEGEMLWVVSKYQPENYVVQYLVTTENRFWTIAIKCAGVTARSTSAEIVYTFTSLNETGTELDKLALHGMYHQDLKDWEQAFNYYLRTGKTLKE